MSANRAVVVDPEAPGRLVIKPVAAPVPDRGRGGRRRPRAVAQPRRGPAVDHGGGGLAARAGTSPAWSSALPPTARARARGRASWASSPRARGPSRSSVPTHALAELPDKVTFSQAATFPVAGLTALHALAKGGLLLGRRVLVTGATGGVGDFAVQLARLAGAHVTASARRADQAAALRQLGAHEVVVGDDIPATPKHDLVLESVGGRTLGTALAALERGGVVRDARRLRVRRGHLRRARVLRHRPHHALRLLPVHRARHRARVGRPQAPRRSRGGGTARPARERRAAVDGDRRRSRRTSWTAASPARRC